VVLHMVGTLCEHDVSLAVAVVHQDKHGRRHSGRVIAVPGRVFGQRLADSVQDFVSGHHLLV